jgi:hypothetical protein
MPFDKTNDLDTLLYAMKISEEDEEDHELIYSWYLFSLLSFHDSFGH